MLGVKTPPGLPEDTYTFEDNWNEFVENKEVQELLSQRLANQCRIAHTKRLIRWLHSKKKDANQVLYEQYYFVPPKESEFQSFPCFRTSIRVFSTSLGIREITPAGYNPAHLRKYTPETQEGLTQDICEAANSQVYLNNIYNEYAPNPLVQTEFPFTPLDGLPADTASFNPVAMRPDDHGGHATPVLGPQEAEGAGKTVEVIQEQADPRAADPALSSGINGSGSLLMDGLGSLNWSELHPGFANTGPFDVMM
ncbi:hypothetical protein J8273_0033 [Carpediemonas membranifera]|uniref:Uncharacterized protein n=1 Tax=Carpediemonas membranifera TaxID=201153 RepID=A0A8J6BCW5_9EUKA|nr:hypothetical protein J8273_0033 [Carpediemonas membranifera]|eukprot:KAG9394827.1 hypothetical protein J8273_0033 [Carpediemonas membranifera]